MAVTISYWYTGKRKEGEVWRGCQAERTEESRNGPKVSFLSFCEASASIWKSWVVLHLLYLLTLHLSTLWYLILVNYFLVVTTAWRERGWTVIGGFVEPRANCNLVLLFNWTEMVFSERWSKREEVDFYRTVSTFGVEYNKKDGTYDWSQFRWVW